jgi:hypothetical protein
VQSLLSDVNGDGVPNLLVQARVKGRKRKELFNGRDL